MCNGVAKSKKVDRDFQEIGKIVEMVYNQK